MSAYQKREITQITLPAAKNVEVLRPETVVLKCEYRVDLGALCYLRRLHGSPSKKGEGRQPEGAWIPTGA